MVGLGTALSGVAEVGKLAVEYVPWFMNPGNNKSTSTTERARRHVRDFGVEVGSSALTGHNMGHTLFILVGLLVASVTITVVIDFFSSLDRKKKSSSWSLWGDSSGSGGGGGGGGGNGGTGSEEEYESWIVTVWNDQYWFVQWFIILLALFAALALARVVFASLFEMMGLSNWRGGWLLGNTMTVNDMLLDWNYTHVLLKLTKEDREAIKAAEDKEMKDVAVIVTDNEKSTLQAAKDTLDSLVMDDSKRKELEAQLNDLFAEREGEIRQQTVAEAQRYIEERRQAYANIAAQAAEGGRVQQQQIRELYERKLSQVESDYATQLQAAQADAEQKIAETIEVAKKRPRSFKEGIKTAWREGQRMERIERHLRSARDERRARLRDKRQFNEEIYNAEHGS